MSRPIHYDKSGEDAIVLAIDVGTTEARAGLFDTHGQLIQQSRNRHTLRFPAPGRVEIDAAELEQSMLSAIAALGPTLRRTSIVSLAAELGTVFLDNHMRSVGNALCWPDKRARDQAAELNETLGAAAVYATTGRVIDPELPACKLRWLRQHEPERAAAISHIVSIKDYLLLRLCGTLVTDETHASYSMLYNVAARRYSEDLLAALEVPNSALPQVVPATTIAGGITEQTARRCGLSAGIPVAVGGPDGTVGTVGAGLVRPGRTVDMVGTADVIFHALSDPLFDPKRKAVLNAHLAPGLWALGGPTGTTGGTLTQLADMLAYDGNLAQLDAEASEIPAGAEGLFCLTPTAGERFPDWERATRGVLFGLRMNHGRAHLARAALEGGAYVLRSALEVYDDLGLDVDEVRLVGGGAGSDVWTQLRADVCATTMRPLSAREATQLGAVGIALTALGVFDDLAEAAESLLPASPPVLPQPEVSRVYQDLFANYRELRSNLVATFRLLDGD